MKRSTVVDLIATWVENEVFMDVYGGHAEEWAGALLYVLETEVGMRPPGFKARVSTGKKYNSETDFAADTYFIKDWEEE